MKSLWGNARHFRASRTTWVHRHYDNTNKSQQRVLLQLQTAAAEARITGWDYLAPVIQEADLEVSSFQHLNTEYFWSCTEEVSGLYLCTTRSKATGIALLLSPQEKARLLCKKVCWPRWKLHKEVVAHIQNFQFPCFTGPVWDTLQLIAEKSKGEKLDTSTPYGTYPVWTLHDISDRQTKNNRQKMNSSTRAAHVAFISWLAG